MSQKPLRWGILATGGIAKNFVYDLEHISSKRKYPHIVTAVGSSSSVQTALNFIKENCVKSNPQAYGSYAGVVQDPQVDIIYVASPNGRHYEDVKLCLDGGKCVLCEKSFTLNAQQAQELFDLARSKNLFVLEGVWTRFTPVAKKVKKLLFEDKLLGNLRYMYADFSKDKELETIPLSDKFLSPELGAGSLLNLGLYNLTWARMLFDLNPNNHREPSIQSTIQFAKRSPTDETTTIVLNYSDLGATVVCRSSHKLLHQYRTIRIEGDNGKSLFLTNGASRPNEIIIQNADGTEYEEPFDVCEGKGFSCEQDEVYECILQNKLECPSMPWSETMSVIRLMDKVRQQNGFKYPCDKGFS